MASEFKTPRSILNLYRSGFIGAICDEVDTKNLLGELPMPVFGAAAYDLYGSGEGKLSLPFKSLLKFDPGFGPAEAQTTGDSLMVDTPIFMADNSTKKVQDVKIGDYVISANGSVKRVINTFRHPARRNLFKVSALKGIYELTLTGNHEMIVGWNDNEPVYKQIENISIGDKIFIPRGHLELICKNPDYDMLDYCDGEAITEDLDFKKLRLEPVAKDKIRIKNGRKAISRYIELDEKLAWLLGLYAAEGGVDGANGNERITFNLGGTEIGFAERVKEYMSDVFGLDVKIYTIPSKPNVIYARVYSNIVANFFKYMCPGNTYTKTLHRDIFDCSNIVKMSLLRGWIDGDGHIDIKQSGSATSVSKNLIRTLHELSISCGLNSRIRLTRAHVDKNQVNHVDAYRISYDKYSIYKLYPELNDGIFNISKDHNDKGIFVELESKEELQNTIGCEVYCIEVEDDHSLIAGGFGVSNCVSHATRNAVDITRAVEIDIKGDPEAFIARGATEGIYQSRGHYRQGMSCSGAARYVHQNGGILIRKDYGDVDLSVYNSSLGARHRIPTSVYIEEAKKHQVKTISNIRTIEEARDALANGYAISLCSGYGFSSRRDKSGIAKRSKGWNHAMAWIACDDTRTRFNETLFLIQNSWGMWNAGPRVHDQPHGSFWIREKDARGMLAGGGGWVFSDVEGFPARKIEYTIDEVF